MELLDGVINIALLLVILVTLVVIHEFGHFIMARRAKVRVHEFGIGFPPRAKIIGRDSETIYTLNWLPIGGFVRLEAEEGESDDPRAFVNQGLVTRLVILLAGVVMNILLAILIFSFIAGFADPVYNARIASVQPDSPAARAGLVGGEQIETDPQGRPIYDDTGDLIVAIDGQRFAVFDSVGLTNDSPQSAYLRQRAGQPVVLSLERADGTAEDVSITLRPPGQPTEGVLGVVFNAFPLEDVSRHPVDAVATGLRRTLDASTLILRGLRDLITNITNPQVSGPVGIVSTVGSFRSELPPIFMLWLIGLLSANLAVVNALPFPPMDGGRVAVSLIQAVSGNRVTPSVERAVYLTGFVLLMSLLVWITFFDVGLLERQT